MATRVDNPGLTAAAEYMLQLTAIDRLFGVKRTQLTASGSRNEANYNATPTGGFNNAGRLVAASRCYDLPAV
jgi:hypothetical protein